MASGVPEYFLPRNWDYPPDGPIRLGNVLSSLKEPHRPLATVKPDADKIIHRTKTNFNIDTEESQSGGISILTTFLSGLLGLGVDTSIDIEKRSVVVLSSFKLSLSTKNYSKLYLRAIVASADNT